MAINRILMSASAAALGLTMATSAMANVYSPPIISGGVGLGFGKFLGSWLTSEPPEDGIASTMPNPSENLDNVVEVGNAILAKHPGLFPIDEFNLAGVIDPFGDDADNSNDSGVGFRVEDKLNDYTAKWTYDGFPVEPGSPGMAPVDLFIAVKTAGYVSIFQFALVDPAMAGGAFGYLSSDYATILLNTADGLESGLNYDGFNDVLLAHVQNSGTTFHNT